MTYPTPLKEQERNQQEWNRKAKDLVNLVARRLMGFGPTPDRPSTPVDGQMFYDGTLKKPVWWNSADAEWKDAAGVAA